jgi:hypothetical protein
MNTSAARPLNFPQSTQFLAARLTFDSAALRAGLTTPRGGSENGEYFD